jgi:hypothetical protein
VVYGLVAMRVCAFPHVLAKQRCLCFHVWLLYIMKESPAVKLGKEIRLLLIYGNGNQIKFLMDFDPTALSKFKCSFLDRTVTGQMLFLFCFFFFNPSTCIYSSWHVCCITIQSASQLVRPIHAHSSPRELYNELV